MSKKKKKKRAVSVGYWLCVCNLFTVSVRWRHLMMFGSTSVSREDRWRWVLAAVPQFSMLNYHNIGICAVHLGYIRSVFVMLFQVFDATNTTRERRSTIVKFAEQNGFKVYKRGWVVSNSIRHFDMTTFTFTLLSFQSRYFLWSLCVRTQMSLHKISW